MILKNKNHLYKLLEYNLVHLLSAPRVNAFRVKWDAHELCNTQIIFSLGRIYIIHLFYGPTRNITQVSFWIPGVMAGLLFVTLVGSDWKILIEK